MTVDFNFVLVDQDLWGIVLQRSPFEDLEFPLGRLETLLVALALHGVLGCCTEQLLLMEDSPQFIVAEVDLGDLLQVGKKERGTFQVLKP